MMRTSESGYWSSQALFGNLSDLRARRSRPFQQVLGGLHERVGERRALPRCRLRPQSHIVITQEQFVDCVKAQRAIGFELLLGEQLIGSGLVRIARKAALVIDDIVVLIAGDGRFYIEQDALLILRIDDFAHGAVRTVRGGMRRQTPALRDLFRCSARSVTNLGPWEGDQDSEIDTRVALQGNERAERHFRISLGIDGDDQLASSAQQLIDTEILDMAAVGEIDRVGILPHQTKQFLQEIELVEYG